jgi:hypothetical protein
LVPTFVRIDLDGAPASNQPTRIFLMGTGQVERVPDGRLAILENQ